MQDIPQITTAPSISSDLIIAVILAVVFVIVWWRLSLGAVASLVMVATAYIVSKGAPFMNSWLEHSGGMAGAQLMISVRLALIIVLSFFALILLRRLAHKVPLIIKTVSACIFTLLLFWYCSEALQASMASTILFSGSKIYATIEQLYPVCLLLALVLSGLELWFASRSGDKKKLKK